MRHDVKGVIEDGSRECLGFWIAIVLTGSSQ